MVENTDTGHYDGDGLAGRLVAALAESGLSGRHPSPDELAPLDQFHTTGLAATVELAAAAGISATDAVLDVGSGLGGPFRYLAATFGCTVTGIDLSQPFVGAATLLSELTGLAGRVHYHCANALAVPFADASFDVVWSQHVAMNISDRPALYAELYRVLKPGGRLAMYDVVTGSGEALHFPVPWSTSEASSFLLRRETMREILERQGFYVENWVDRTADGVAWVQQQRQPRTEAAGDHPGLGLHLAMGPGFPKMSANLSRNLIEGRVGLQQAVMRRP